jgi:hypothetical protein
MTKYKVNLTVTYELKGKLLAEYLEWLDDYKDTEAMRKDWLIDRFIGHDNYATLTESGIVDPRAKIRLEKEKGK